MTTEFRPTSGRILTVAIGVTCLVALVATWSGSGWRDALQTLPWLALVSGTCWAVMWRPRVEVSDGGVRIVNVIRTIDVPWPAIEGVETRWALTVRTAYGSFTAWAAPSAGRGPARRSARAEVRILGRPLGRAEPTVVSPGAALEAATLVRSHWETLRAAGHLDNPRLEHDSVPVRWHLETIAAGVALVGLGIITALA